MNQDQVQNVSYGTCKVKDGLYIGDEFAAKDLEFIMINKIGSIVNTTSLHVQNYWDSIGIVYISFQMSEHEIPSPQQIELIYNFIEESSNQGQSCLIHSVHGQSRACSIVAIYLMRKYNWTLYKTLEYLNSRRNDLEIKTTFFQLLGQVEQLHANQHTLSQTWDEIPGTEGELIVRNTYLNAIASAIDPVYSSPEQYKLILGKDIKTKIKWTEQHIHKQPSYKSILKGSKQLIIKDRKIISPSEIIKQYDKENQSVQIVDKSYMDLTFAVPLNKNLQGMEPTNKPFQGFDYLSKPNYGFGQKQLPLFDTKENIPPLKKSHRSQSSFTSEYDKQADVIRKYLRDNESKQFSNQLEEPPMMKNEISLTTKHSRPNSQSVKPKIQKESKPEVKPKQKQDAQYKSYNNIPRNISKSVTGAVHKVNSLNNVAKPMIVMKPRMPNFDDPKIMKKYHTFNIKRNIDISGLVNQFQPRSRNDYD